MMSSRIPHSPRATLEDFRSFGMTRYIDDIGIWFGMNPPCIDARKMILHLSDTPSTIFPYLKRMIRRLNPAWIVHTGDFIDNIKLERYPGMLDLYQKKISSFLDIFRGDEEDYGGIIITGNHDDAETLYNSDMPNNLQLWTHSGKFSIGRFTFAAGHRYSDIASSPAQYNLFGHDMTHKTGEDEQGRIFLNGLEGVFLIDIESGNVTSLAYPQCTNGDRLIMRKFSV